jgi:hypothetical protein
MIIIRSRFPYRVSRNSFGGYRDRRVPGKAASASRRGGEVLPCSSRPEVRVGMEASGHGRRFERLMAELQFELGIGDAAEAISPISSHR